MQYRSYLPHDHFFLDAHIAAVPLAVPGLTCFFIQYHPAFATHLLAHLRRRTGVETMHCYHRRLLGLPLYFSSLLLVAAALSAAATLTHFLSDMDLPILPADDVFAEGPIPVVSEMSGRIERIYVKEGAAIRIGDPVVQLDTRELQHRKRRLEDRIHAAELGRMRDRAALQRLYRELEQLQLDLNRCTIVSTAEGVIFLVRQLHVGDVLDAGSAIGIVIPRTNSKSAGSL